jgi:hypothetical protein
MTANPGCVSICLLDEPSPSLQAECSGRSGEAPSRFVGVVIGGGHVMKLGDRVEAAGGLGGPDTSMPLVPAGTEGTIVGVAGVAPVTFAVKFDNGLSLRVEQDEVIPVQVEQGPPTAQRG